jgi:hypothetical protein
MKGYFVGLIMLFFAAGVKSQGFSVGGNLSLNNSWILNQNSYEVLQVVCPEDPLISGSEPGYALTMGYSIGAKAVYDSDAFWGVSAELNYTKRGQNYKEDWRNNNCPGGNLLDFKRKFNLHYFEMPMLVLFKTQNRGKLNWYGEAGLQIGLLMGAKEKISYEGISESDATFGSAKDKVKSFDMGLVLGGGAQYELANSLFLNAGLRTYFGFLDINKGGAAVFVSNNDDKYQSSRNFSIGANVGVVYVFDWVGGIYR